MSIKIEKGLSVVKLHIKSCRGSELKIEAELPEIKAREISRAFYVAQTGRVDDSDEELIRRLNESGYPEAAEVARRLKWVIGLEKMLADELSRCIENVDCLLNMMPEDLQKLEAPSCD